MTEPTDKSPSRTPEEVEQMAREQREAMAKKLQAQAEMKNWPLEADRVAIKSPLVECLVLVAGHYGRRVSVNSLTAGLPVPKSGISPLLFIRAAERADLTARLVQKPLAALAIAPNLPCIAVLDGRQACIIQAVNHPKDSQQFYGDKKNKGRVHPETSFTIVMPETPDQAQEISLKELAGLYSGQLFFVRPHAQVDERAGHATIDEGRDWFWSAVWENKPIYIEVAMAAVAINIFAIASPLFVMNVYDRVVPNNAIATLWVLALGVLLAFLFDFFLKNLRSSFLDAAGRRADIKISSRIFEHVLGMKLAERPASAGVLTSNMKDFESIRDFFTSATLVSLIDLPFSFLFIAIIAIIGGPIAFVPLLAMPIVIVVGWVMQKRMMNVIRESMAENAMKNALLFETVIGMETVKVQAAESHQQRMWEELTHKSTKTSNKLRKISSFTQNWAMFIQQSTSVFIIIVGTYLIAEGHITMGAIIASVMLSGRVLAPLAQVAGLLTRLNQTRESLKQLDDLMAKKVERPAKKHFISMSNVRGHVEFRDVVFHYPEQTTAALKNINFSIKPGEHVGIIGAVGSGKTTVQRLLMNLYEPSSGAILLDGTDVRQIDPGDLRRNIGVVQQRPQLFYGSVRQNITMGNEMAPERAVLKAAELSGVMEFLRDTQHGLDTQVGERGEALSGGQQQAVAVARALLYDPPVIIMDEPTASMDPASETRLMKHLNNLTRDRTVILITHKGTMLNIVDRLVLMDRGHLIADGEKEAVIERLRKGEFNRGNSQQNQEGENNG